MLSDYLDGHCVLQNQRAAGNIEAGADVRSCYDFLYLPFDFRTKANKGYAFVNFTTPAAAWNFCLAAGNRPWAHCRSRKLAVVVRAKLQGLRQLLDRFEPTVFPCDSGDFLPIRFDPPRDGSGRDDVAAGQCYWTVGRCRRRF
ncbi:unnamed protein product [Linum tenue]|uniref:Mei2-like C-terminal RNA recognition motif domain-containing protein n=1 Tax=Linum tenue TaxID=586396 RepID=A0AAV0GS92_9ROSI|nr:unnamed protein product [Linum tenue]